MTKSDFIFMLVRTALWKTPIDHFEMTPKEYRLVMEDGEKQCIMGLISDCLRSNNMGLQKKCVIHMLKLQNSLLAENKKINENLMTLCNLLQANNIKFFVVKGQTIGVFYPKPELRMPGDIDFYVPPADFQKAIDVINAEWGLELSNKQKGKHLEFDYNDSYLEMHRILREFPYRKTQKDFDTILAECEPVYVKVDGCDVPTLPPTFNVVYTFLHLYHHFVKLGVAVRQLCDLAILLHQHRDDIDKAQLREWLERLGFINAFTAFGTILIEKIGLPEEDFPFPLTATDRSYGAKALKLILKHGNWGKYDRKTKDKQSLAFMIEKTYFRISNQFLFMHLSPKYNRSLIFGELPQKTAQTIKNFFKKEK